jgi:DNA-binding transcriptional LysR family regulator
MKVENQLSRMNLTHLRALDALLSERSVTRAARRLGLSQSAISHALRGLRDTLGDELLVRGGGGMVPTARAEALAQPLHRALRELEAALAIRPGFDAATSRRTFTLSMPDGFALTTLPGLLRILRDEAPGIDLDVRPPMQQRTTAMALESGEVDLAVGGGLDAASGLRTRVLLDETFACLVRSDHPSIKEGLDLDTYCALPHALMSPSGSGLGVVDRALATLGRSRRVAVRIRFFLAAPTVVANSDMVLTGPRDQLRRFTEMAPLRLLEPPLALPGFRVRIYWHDRTHDEPAHQWLREAIVRGGARA